jgi:hypothetical protein
MSSRRHFALGAALALSTLLHPQLARGSEFAHSQVVSEIPASWTPHLVKEGTAEPAAYSISQSGNTIVVGGEFTAVDNAARTVIYPRSNVFAFDATTGAVRDFAPTVDGKVWSVLAIGNDVYIGGEFRTVNGVNRAALAKLNLLTGALDPNFRPPFTSSRVTDMELVDGRLIISGTFQKNLLALNPTTGRLTTYINVAISGPLPFTTRTEVFRFDVSPDGANLVGVGNFTSVNGQSRWRVFMLDLGESLATLSAWRYAPLERPCHAQTNPTLQTYVRDVDFAPDSSYFVLASTGGHILTEADRFTVLCDTVVRFERSILNPAAPTWMNKTGGDTLFSVLATGAAVYVQGHNRWLDNPFGRDSKGPGAVDRLGGGAVDSVTGKALDWNPNMPARIGGFQIMASATGVWFVTDGVWFNGRNRRGIRFVPLQ